MLTCVCAHFLLHSRLLQSKHSAPDQHTEAVRKQGSQCDSEWLWRDNSSVVQMHISTPGCRPWQQRLMLRLYRMNLSFPSARNPSLSSSCQMEATAKSQLSLCYQHSCIGLCPPKAQNSSSTSALPPQAGLGPGANKTLKPYSWDALHNIASLLLSWCFTLTNG